MVPDELGTLFQRVVPQAPVRSASGRWPASTGGPGGAGRDRVRGHVRLYLAAVGVRFLRPVRGHGHRRFTEWSKARVWANLHDANLHDSRALTPLVKGRTPERSGPATAATPQTGKAPWRQGLR